MFKKFLLRFFVLTTLFTSFSFVVPVSVEAQGLKDAFKTSNDNTDAPLSDAASTAGYDTADADTKFNTIISTMIQVVLSMLGVVFLILMVYGGFLWMTARGNESQVEKSKNLITAAIIGLAIVVGAYIITYFVISKISKGLLK